MLAPSAALSFGGGHMSDENGKTLIRIERSLERILMSMQETSDTGGQLDIIAEQLDKLLAQAEKQTALLEKLWANDRGRD
jgi:hypothetical protein